MLEFQQGLHLRNVKADLRKLFDRGSFASLVARQIGTELTYRFVDFELEEEVEPSRLDPVGAVFHALAGGWRLDPEWLADEDGNCFRDDGERLLASIERRISPVDHLAAYGLFLIEIEFNSLGEVPVGGAEPGANGWSREQVLEYRAGCLLYAYQALAYARQWQTGVKLDEAAIAQAVRSAGARKAAEARHATDPKQGAKAFVFERWQDWQRHSDRYATAAAFARDMLDKQPDLQSEVVVARWARLWARGDKPNPAR